MLGSRLKERKSKFSVNNDFRNGPSANTSYPISDRFRPVAG